MAEDNKTGLMVLGIVGIVAIVGLAVLYMSKTSSSSAGELTTSDEWVDATDSGADSEGIVG